MAVSTSPQTLLFLIGSLKKGGAERNLARVASFAASLGNEVKIMLFDNTVEFPLHPSVSIIDLKVGKTVGHWYSPLSMWWKVARTLWQERPSKAVAFTRLASQFLSATFYPRVYVRYDIYPFYMKTRRWLSSVILFNLPNVRKVVSPSKELHQLLNRYFLNRKKIVQISNPVATPSIGEQVLDHQTTPQQPYFIYLGRLSNQKKVNLLIDAFKRSGLAGRFRLLIVGDGPARTELEELVKKAELTNSVRFTGFIKEPHRLVQQAHTLVLSSIREGFPNVLVEALGLGVPVISTMCPTGPREIVSNGENGLLVEMNNIGQLAEAMCTMASDTQLYNAMKANARNSVKAYEEHGIMEQWRQLLELN